MFDVITSDKKTQELLRMKEKGERDFNSAMKNSRLQGIARGIAKGRVEGIAKGRIEGRVEGKAEGRIEEKKQTAQSMLQDGMSISTISKYTGLSISEIQLLKSH
jgi:predicted transposase/invertase (TIGR01784 family)